jgi:hypothetical protein
MWIFSPDSRPDVLTPAATVIHARDARVVATLVLPYIFRVRVAASALDDVRAAWD